MTLTNALTISIGILAGLATWACAGPLAATNTQIWIIFVAWAAYFHSGGTATALSSNIPGHILGAIVGWLALVTIWHYPDLISGPVIAAIAVAIGAAIIVQMSKVSLFANIPTAVLAFACIAGYTLLAGKMGSLYSTDPFANPLSITIISMIAGAIIGWLSETLASSLSS